MKVSHFVLLACLSAGWAQTVPGGLPGSKAPSSAPAPVSALPDLPDETVIAVFDDGVSLTMAEFRRIYAVLPAENQQMVLRDRQGFLKQWALMRKLTQMAEKQKLDEESPTRESLDYQRMIILSQAKLLDVLSQVKVPQGEAERYYQDHRDKYKDVRVKALYLTFDAAASGAAAGKGRGESQAKALAEKLRADLRGGADFAKLARENSDDETSRAKDGDFATIRGSDNIPEVVRTAVLALHQSEISEPIRQPNGFYLFRAEEVHYRGFAEVSDEIYSVLKQQHYGQWLEQTSRDTKVQYKSPEFLSAGPADPKPAGGH